MRTKIKTEVVGEPFSRCIRPELSRGGLIFQYIFPHFLSVFWQEAQSSWTVQWVKVIHRKIFQLKKLDQNSGISERPVGWQKIDKHAL